MHPLSRPEASTDILKSHAFPCSFHSLSPNRADLLSLALTLIQSRPRSSGGQVLEAEGDKRKAELESEGQKIRMKNESEGTLIKVTNEAEAKKIQLTLEAEGEAAVIEMRAHAQARAIETIAKALQGSLGQEAAKLNMAKGACVRVRLPSVCTISILSFPSSSVPRFHRDVRHHGQPVQHHDFQR